MKLTEADRADWLELQLKQLVDKLEGLIRERTRQRHALLGDKPGDRWSGSKRNRFDTDFDSQQTALIGLKGAAMQLRGIVIRTMAESEKNDKNDN